MTRGRKAEYWAAKDTQHGQSGLPVIAELKKDENFNPEVFRSMFSGQIRDALVSGGEALPKFSPNHKEDWTEEGPLEAARNVLSTFSPLLPYLTAVAADKQDRHSAGEIQLVVNEPTGEGTPAQPDFGFKLVGATHGASEWILPGKLVPDDDTFHSSLFSLESNQSNHPRTTVPDDISEVLREPAAHALASNSPWAFTYSNHELVILRFYKIGGPEQQNGTVRVGAVYYPVPALPPGTAASTDWEHRDLFPLPWYRGAPQSHRRALSYHLGLWVALLALLRAPDEPVGTARRRDLFSEREPKRGAVADPMGRRYTKLGESEGAGEEHPRKRTKCCS